MDLKKIIRLLNDGGGDGLEDTKERIACEEELDEEWRVGYSLLNSGSSKDGIFHLCKGLNLKMMQVECLHPKNHSLHQSEGVLYHLTSQWFMSSL